MVSEAGNGLLRRLGGTTGLVASGFRSGPTQREILRDLFEKGDDIVGLYNSRVGLRREEDGGIGGGHRGGGSFVAYVGGDASIHTEGREVDVGTRGGVSVHGGNSLALMNNASWENEETKTLDEETWSTTAATGDRRLTEEGKGKAGTSIVSCMDAAPFAEANRAPERQTEEDNEERRQELQLHQLAETSLDEETPRRAQQAYGSTNCMDCGNQAKKDCNHQRCRTCCRSRGFVCLTHVKSTWVPASKRKERYAALSSAETTGPARCKRINRGTAETDATNRATSLTPTSARTSPRDSEINSGNPSQHLLPCSTFGDECSTAYPKGNLPADVKAQAVFKCVRVTGLEDEQNEYAYQATVKIGGHIFKGVLYDQGLENGITVTNLTQLQLGGKIMPSISALNNSGGIYGSSGSVLLGALK